uniref:Protein CLP1 homolog n=1 Tax=Rhabditophanes sp. KR3021 TaxID=114890 RepID=A0AC35UCA1_9BILA
MNQEDDCEPKEYKLSRGSEFRFVSSQELTIELLEGRAELFGTELIKNKRYTFASGKSAAIFTFVGATIEVIGPKDVGYVSDKTPMRVYLDIHARLEKGRSEAMENLNLGRNGRGPRILIAGPVDVGKSTLTKILLNYAVRSGRTPLYVELDVGQGNISVPGTLAALFMETTADILDDYNTKANVTIHFGHTSPASNFDLFKNCLKTLSDLVHRKSMSSNKINASGIIINTCGWVEGEGYESLKIAAQEFEVKSIVVVEHERLYHRLKRDIPAFVNIQSVEKSSGIEARNSDTRRNARTNFINRYFYGSSNFRLSPHSFPINFSDVVLAKIGTEPLPESCLPYGMKVENSKTKVVTIPLTASLKDHILAVTPPGTLADQSLLTTPVAGYVCVTSVDMEKKVLNVLSPQPSLHNKVLIWSDVTFIDDNSA